MISLLDSENHSAFPDPESAERDPDGLLAVGGDLSPARLLNAYRQGIFPWYSEDQPILWWSPDPRMVLFPERLHLSRSLRKSLRQAGFQLSYDQAFIQVIDACAAPRKNDTGTWITTEMRTAYIQMHHLGHAHSVEVWHQGRLVGGIYGIALGKVFFGESMFHRATNASKTALAGLVYQLRQWDFGLIDCQVHTDHLASLGAERIPRTDFIHQLKDLCRKQGAPTDWRRIPTLPATDLLI
jgi:leucyl/phenylalanyl-tRNA--protein transferase